jgi:hypothetical protein
MIIQVANGASGTGKAGEKKYLEATIGKTSAVSL